MGSMVTRDLLDAFYDWSMDKFGEPVSLGIFNHDLLVPLDDATEMVKMECGFEVFVEVLRSYVDEELLPRLHVDDQSLGLPLYIPGRVGFIRKLEGKGYSRAEIREIVQSEDELIHEVLTSGSLEYKNGAPLEVCIADIMGNLEGVGIISELFESRGKKLRSKEDKREQEQMLDSLSSCEYEQLSDTAKDYVARRAFKVSFLKEWMRVWFLAFFRAKVLEGFSPEVEFKSWSFDGDLLEWQGIDWAVTLLNLGQRQEIRMPDLTVKRNAIEITTPLTPSMYQEVFEKYNLEEFSWPSTDAGQGNGQRVCAHCGSPLPRGSRPARVYCSERCRLSHKSKRWRRRNPDKYMESLAKHFRKYYPGVPGNNGRKRNVA